MKTVWAWVEIISLGMMVSFGINIAGGFILATCQGTSYIKFPINAVGEQLFETILLPIVTVVCIIILYRHVAKLILKGKDSRDDRHIQ